MQVSKQGEPIYEWSILDSEHYYGLKNWGI